jgi:hypothetical protein
MHPRLRFGQTLGRFLSRGRNVPPAFYAYYPIKVFPECICVFMRSMAELDHNTLLRAIEDFETTLAELQSNNAVLATPVLLRRLGELEVSTLSLGDRVLIATIEKLRRHLTTGKGLDG